MKIIVANRDRTAELGPSLKVDAEQRARDPRCLFLDWSVNALSLSDATSEVDYLDRFIRLTRYKNHVDTRIFDIPRSAGLKGRIMTVVKQVLWKVLRYQHDRMAFRQNLVNSNLIAAVEFQRDAMKRMQDEMDSMKAGRGSA